MAKISIKVLFLVGIIMLTGAFTAKVRLDINSTPEKAKVRLVKEEKEKQQPVENIELGETHFFPTNFYEFNSKHTWKIQVAKSDYETVEKVITYDEVKKIKQIVLAVTLNPLVKRVDLPIRANVDNCGVYINEKLVTNTLAKNTPMNLEVVFTRPKGTSPWNTLSLRIAKEGYLYWPSDKSALELSLGVDTVPKIVEASFHPAGFFETPLPAFEVRADQVKLVQASVLSEIKPQVDEKTTPTLQIDTNSQLLILSRISPIPAQKNGEKPRGVFVYSLANLKARDERNPGTQSQDDRIMGANLWVWQEGASRQLTQGPFFDLDPFADADGYVYYSSDRGKNRSIWRTRLSGAGGYTPITGVYTYFDTEPAVSPNCQRLAFTSRKPDAPAGAPSNIWISDAEGKLPTLRWEGHSPAWSPDGNKIAFISADNSKICIVEVDGGANPTQYPLGDSIVVSPIWSPSGKHILYASNNGLNMLKEKNYDIWSIGVSQDSTMGNQLTTDGSFDSFPALVPNSVGNPSLLFYSNRGAQRPGQNTLQIYRLNPTVGVE
jgi:hypothetical protein